MTARPQDRPRVGVVTVTYNSDRFFDTFMRSLALGERRPDCVVLVDSGSPEPAFLDRAESFGLPVRIFREQNVGFAAGSNLGWRAVRAFDYILFLNPDAFLTPTCLQQAVAYLEAEPTVGMVTPSLIRYDLEAQRPLDVIDTTGVVRNRLGLLVERDAGCPVETLERYGEPNDVPWLCAAAVLCRREALEAVAEPPAPELPVHRADAAAAQLFDESFFMYKEDTDLAWRVRRAGWRLVHHPALVGYHCRGWQDRKAMPRRLRLLTARNEIKMSLKNRSPFMLISILKYLLVFTLDW